MIKTRVCEKCDKETAGVKECYECKQVLPEPYLYVGIPAVPVFTAKQVLEAHAQGQRAMAKAALKVLTDNPNWEAQYLTSLIRGLPTGVTK